MSGELNLSYLRFLHLVNNFAKRDTKKWQMDAIEERLLNLLASQWHTNRYLSVVEAMNLMPEISPSTTYRKLKALREKGLVQLEVDPADNRIKYVRHTKETKEYFTQLSKYMETVMVT